MRAPQRRCVRAPILDGRGPVSTAWTVGLETRVGFCSPGDPSLHACRRQCAVELPQLVETNEIRRYPPAAGVVGCRQRVRFNASAESIGCHKISVLADAGSGNLLLSLSNLRRCSAPHLRTTKAHVVSSMRWPARNLEASCACDSSPDAAGPRARLRPTAADQCCVQR